MVHTTRKRTPEVYHRGADHPRSSYLRKHMNVYEGTTVKVPTVATVARRLDMNVQHEVQKTKVGKK